MQVRRFTTEESCPEHSGERWCLCRAAGVRTGRINSPVEITCLCLQHINTGVDPYDQKLSNFVVFPSWHLRPLVNDSSFSSWDICILFVRHAHLLAVNFLDVSCCTLTFWLNLTCFLYILIGAGRKSSRSSVELNTNCYFFPVRTSSSWRRWCRVFSMVRGSAGSTWRRSDVCWRTSSSASSFWVNWTEPSSRRKTPDRRSYVTWWDAFLRRRLRSSIIRPGATCWSHSKPCVPVSCL